MSEDLIKRSDAVIVVYKALRTPPLKGVLTDTVPLAIELVHGIPSADRPSGEWIFKPTFPNDKSEFPMGSLVCSVCGSHHSNSTPCNYCDNCGARMKGADDEMP